GKTGDDMAGRGHALGATGKDEPSCRDVERQPQHRRDQQNGRKCRELEGFLNPQRNHEHQDRERKRECEPSVDELWWERQEKDRQDENDSDREPDILSSAVAYRLGGCCRRRSHESPPVLAETRLRSR